MESGISSALEFGITILILTVFTVLSLSILVAFIYALSELKTLISAYKSKKTKVYSESVIGKNTDITELMLLDNIDKGIFDTSLVGRVVRLDEGLSTHDWTIIRVNEDSYDLWYNGSIGEARWDGMNIDRYWCNQSNYQDKDEFLNVKNICDRYMAKISPILEPYLKTGLNVNCGDSKIVILSIKQLGFMTSNINDSNTSIPYFNNDDKRKIENNSEKYDYWTTSACPNTGLMWAINTDGSITYDNYFCSNCVVPAIRVGK